MHNRRLAAIAWLLEAVGLALLVAGVAMWSLPAGLVVAGVGLMLAALVVEGSRRAAPPVVQGESS